MSEMILETVDFEEDGITMFAVEYKGEKHHKLDYSGAWQDDIDGLAVELACGVANLIADATVDALLPHIKASLEKFASGGEQQIQRQPSWPTQAQLDEVNAELERQAQADQKACEVAPVQCGNPECYCKSVRA